MHTFISDAQCELAIVSAMVRRQFDHCELVIHGDGGKIPHGVSLPLVKEEFDLWDNSIGDLLSFNSPDLVLGGLPGPDSIVEIDDWASTMCPEPSISLFGDI